MRPAAMLTLAALIVALASIGAHAALAQQAAPTATPAPTATASNAPTAQPAPAATLPPAPAAPTTAPATIPTPEPTLTLPEAFDRILSGEKPAETLVALVSQRPPVVMLSLLILALLIGTVVAVVKPWRERLLRTIDRRTGGERRDVQAELEREETKKALAAAREAERTKGQARTARDAYLVRLEQDMLRLAKIPALGREQRELDLEKVYVPLYVVERDQLESFDRYSLGEFHSSDEARARATAYAAVQESRPVFRLLSESDRLPKPEPDTDGSARRLPQPRSKRAQEQEQTTTRLLLVGRAGSGKTTTLHYGALILARTLRTRADGETQKELQLFTRSRPFPVYARLTELMTYVREHYAQRRADLVGAPAHLLLDALDELARRDVPDLPLGELRRQIEAGGCLVMLDGLDETGDADERGAAMDLIASLVRACASNRYIVASRPFDGLSERLPDFTERHLRPLDADDIRKLLNKLFLALRLPEDHEGQARNEADALVPEAAELWRNLERSPRLFDMATNPLLLTSMAVLVEGREPLPVERAKIYEKLVRLTIEAWRKAQIARDQPGVAVKLFEESDDSVRLRLQLLAADMLEQERREITLSQARDLLRPIYRTNYPGWNHERCDDYVRELLHQIALHSGLLQARDSDSLFSFTHFTLQEYLAARHYTEQRRDKQALVQALIARWPERRWRETILLAIGHEATSGSRETAQDLLQTLLNTEQPESIVLAGDALDEANARAVGELTRQRLDVSAQLRAFAFDPVRCPDPQLRNNAATLLDRLGGDDDRLGLALGRDDYWARRIEPGPFLMGDNQSDQSDEKPAFEFTIRQPYALARYPVTNRQYLRYLEDLERRGAEGRSEAEQRRPRYWPGRRYRPGEGNHPVVGVSWEDASAFAGWANETLLTPEQRAAGEQIRLPSEPEWERAAAYPVVLPPGAQFAGRRAYPWGAWPSDAPATDNDPLLASLLGTAPMPASTGTPANTGEAKIRGTSAVGIFPHGAADCGAEELAGNVWEWCASAYQSYPLPEDEERLYNGQLYVARGGAYYSERTRVRCGYRDLVYPDNFYGNFGFRLVRRFSSGRS